jgi:hypothetical protein
MQVTYCSYDNDIWENMNGWVNGNDVGRKKWIADFYVASWKTSSCKTEMETAGHN